ncbi:glutaminase A [Ramlibacter sp.]|uniref:glutaminase A n=1 Tax=Ramlibacter sp. TaxID=1917967 RepID=UPI003D0E4788
MSHLPSSDPAGYLDDLLVRFRPLTDGSINGASEALGDTEPERFGVALATVDGQVFGASDDGVQFAIQSISKPFLYGLALDLFGREKVHAKVAVEPTTEAFNSLTELEEDHLPYNPMINSGAIAISAMLHHADPDSASATMMAMLGRYMGREATRHPRAVDDVSGAHRNLAIAHLLRHFEVIGDDIVGSMKLYNRQCTATANVRELALMAATLANGGEHPVTDERAIRRDHVGDVLTLMFTCGMYDTSGSWAYTVGLPAKSGVGGGILAVVPGRMGLAVYSPRLDSHGHSVRAVAALRAWSADWNLAMFRL